MYRSDILLVFSWIFGPVDEETWHLACRDEWADFLDSIARESGLDARSSSVLARLAEPPSFEEKTHFSSRHFTGGLPVSALPIESLYITVQGADHGPEYFREPAWYMRDLVESLGLAVPPAFTSYPDHLSLELEVASILWASDEAAARDFTGTRFGWLRAYGEKLSSIDADTSFYAAAIEALAAIIDAWRVEIGVNEGETREER